MSRRCARPGCHAYATRASRYCWFHRNDAPADELLALVPSEEPDDALLAMEAELRRRAESFDRLIKRGQPGDLVEETIQAILGAAHDPAPEQPAPVPLAGEILALRLVLARVIKLDALDGNPRELALTVARLVDTTVRAVRAQRGLGVDDPDEARAAITAALIELSQDPSVAP